MTECGFERAGFELQGFEICAGGGGFAQQETARQNYKALLKQYQPKVPKAKVKGVEVTSLSGSIVKGISTKLNGMVRGWNITQLTSSVVVTERSNKLKSKLKMQLESRASGRVKVEDGVSKADTWIMTPNRTERDKRMEKLEKLLKIYLRYKNHG